MIGRVLRVGLVLLAATALALPTPAAATAAVATPFLAEFTAVATFVPTSTPGVLAGTTSGDGRATHLGRVTTSSTETVDATSPTGELAIRDGRGVLVAANGDELHWSYDGVGSPPDAEGDLTLSGTFTITGGTGRFADATGGGTFSGAASVVTGVGMLTYVGTLRH